MIVRPPSAAAGAARALVAGLAMVARSPATVVLAYLSALAIAAPVTAVLAITLRNHLDAGYPIRRDLGFLDGDWWIGLDASGALLARLFSPRTLGFAAPLDSLTVLLDGNRPHVIALLAAIGYALVWAFVWAIALPRFAAMRGAAPQDWRARVQWCGPFVAISAVAALAVAVLYLTVHPLLFRWLYPAVASGLDEPAAFLIRAGHYAVFGALLVGVSAAADLARASAISLSGRSPLRSFAGAVAFMASHPAPVAVVCLTSLLVAAVLLGAYGAAEVFGGPHVGGWRGVAIAQLFIGLRIALRLWWGASWLVLYRDNVRASQPPAAR